LIKDSKYIRLIIFHVLIGFFVYGFEFLSKVYFIAIVVFFGFKILNSSSDKRYIQVLVAASYVVGCEVFLRMTDGSFLYEASKYLVILFIFMGMLFDGIKNKAFPYFLYLLLLIPAIIVAGANADYDTNIRTAIAFNLSGPVCLGIVALYCYDKRIRFKELQVVLLAALLPLITNAVYLFLYTPNIRDVITGTQSNFEASGGFGPNQVATVLGLGMFIIAVRFFLASKQVFLKIINLAILGLISYRAIVTFSRGGVLVAAIIIVAFVIIYYLSSVHRNRQKIVNYLVSLLIIFLMTWLVSSFQTGGFIDKRYANQDAAGRDKENISTGRSDLIAFELNEFVENPFLGIGVGKVKEIRYQKEGVEAASHNEVSRILAEHGLLGFFGLIIILIIPLAYRLRNKKNIFFYSFYLFWFLTINHSSMRIAAPAFIYGLSLLNVHYDKSPLHRKQVIKKR